jgi:hypothetical protein
VPATDFFYNSASVGGPNWEFLIYGMSEECVGKKTEENVFME